VSARDVRVVSRWWLGEKQKIIDAEQAEAERLIAEA
jgi:hypothetical protein